MEGPTRPDQRRVLGQAGESIAARYLSERGLTLITRGWRCALGEIDLVMREGETLVFVEVRTRRGEQLGAAIESITARKAARLVRLALLYLAMGGPARAQLAWRIDVVAIQVDRRGHPLTIDHIVSAVEDIG